MNSVLEAVIFSLFEGLEGVEARNQNRLNTYALADFMALTPHQVSLEEHGSSTSAAS
jgi:hypothetical protein